MRFSHLAGTTALGQLSSSSGALWHPQQCRPVTVQVHCSTHTARITAASRTPLKVPPAASATQVGKGSAIPIERQPQQLQQQLQPPDEVVTQQHEQHVQPVGTTAQTKQARPPYGAGRVLRALCQYSPQGLSDGPASLSKVGCPSCACSYHLVCMALQCNWPQSVKAHCHAAATHSNMWPCMLT
jgi:hypothetical protein